MEILNNEYYFDKLETDILFAHRKDQNYRNIFHSHDGYEIYLFISGNVNMLFEHSCYHLEKGNLVIMNPQEFHLAVSLDDSYYERITLNISSSIMQSISTVTTNFITFLNSKRPNIDNTVLLSEEELQFLIRLMKSLDDNFNSGHFGSDVMAHAYLIQILCYVCDKFRNSKNMVPNIMPKIVSDIMIYVEQHLTENITLSDLQNELNFNSRYLSNQFKMNTGITLKQYIIEKKVNLAKSFLLQGCSVTETCYKSGFNDYANFIRLFKRQTGVPPGHYYSKNNNVPN